MRSLRRTLSVRFAITKFLALSVIALWASVGARRILREELDRGLVAAARLGEAALGRTDRLPQQHGFTTVTDYVAGINRFTVLRSSSGEELSLNTPLARGLPFDSTGLETALHGRPVWVTEQWERQGMRSVYFPVTRPEDTPRRVLQVSASLRPMAGAGREVLLLMFGTVLLGTVATLMGAGWLAASATAPVGEIASQARAVAPGHVGQRITAHAGIEEFRGLVEVLNEMLERLDQGLLAQRRIIRDVGHDLRTPITAIQGTVEVGLRTQRPAAQYQQILASVLEDVGHLGTIADTLLTLGRIEAGELEPNLAVHPVSDVVSASVARARPRATSHHLVWTPPITDSEAHVDADLLGLALDQLLDNGIRHTPGGTIIDVGVSTAPHQVLITVTDNGPGVAPEALPHLFERFYRADAARGRHAGAGLGLTVVSAILAAHDGSAVAERGDLGGVRIAMTIPRNSSS